MSTLTATRHRVSHAPTSDEDIATHIAYLTKSVVGVYASDRREWSQKLEAIDAAVVVVRSAIDLRCRHAATMSLRERAIVLDTAATNRMCLLFVEDEVALLRACDAWRGRVTSQSTQCSVSLAHITAATKSGVA